MDVLLRFAQTIFLLVGIYVFDLLIAIGVIQYVKSHADKSNKELLPVVCAFVTIVPFIIAFKFIVIGG